MCQIRGHGVAGFGFLVVVVVVVVVFIHSYIFTGVGGIRITGDRDCIDACDWDCINGSISSRGGGEYWISRIFTSIDFGRQLNRAQQHHELSFHSSSN
jgi:hypothetical protein